jgi:hypothetical protein
MFRSKALLPCSGYEEPCALVQSSTLKTEAVYYSSQNIFRTIHLTSQRTAIFVNIIYDTFQRSRKPKLTAVGIRCADHATLSIR